MGRVRVCRPDDIPELVRLRHRVFRSTEQPSDESLAAYYQRIFFENPWRDEAFPSLVCEGAQGQPVGFMGVVPRPMLFQGEPVRATVSTEFMVDPEERGLAGVDLLRSFMQGSQDLVVSDRANDAARALIEAFGGVTLLWYSLYWVRPLRPAGYALEQLGWRGVARGVRLALRPAARLFDACATRLVAGRYYQQGPAGVAEPLEVDTILTTFQRVAEKHRLVPSYDKDSLRWLLGRLEERVITCGPLHRVQIRDSGGGVIGWFLYYLNPERRAEVMQLAAVEGHRGQVLDHLLHHAWRRGAVLACGRLDAPFVGSLLERGCSFALARPWTLMHSRRRELVDVFQSGAAFLSRMDSEWWLGF